MSLRLLLDEHLSPVIAEMLRERGVDAVALQQWKGGRYLEQADDTLLLQAAEEARSLVSYDVSTLPRQGGELVATGRAHAGIVLISSKTIKADSYAEICDALEAFSNRFDSEYMQNLVVILGPPP